MKIKAAKTMNHKVKEIKRFMAKKQKEQEVVEIKKRKPGGGRKSKHTTEIDKAAEELCKQGYTDEQLAAFFGVDKGTINNWKKQFPLFFNSLKTGKEMADSRVEASLFQRAVGYSVPDVHISSYEGEVTQTPIIKHYPPDTTAQIFWLKNRQPKKWRDKSDLNLSGEVKAPALKIVLNKK